MEFHCAVVRRRMLSKVGTVAGFYLPETIAQGGNKFLLKELTIPQDMLLPVRIKFCLGSNFFQKHFEANF